MIAMRHAAAVLLLLSMIMRAPAASGGEPPTCVEQGVNVGSEAPVLREICAGTLAEGAHTMTLSWLPASTGRFVLAIDSEDGANGLVHDCAIVARIVKECVLESRSLSAGGSGTLVGPIETYFAADRPLRYAVHAGGVDSRWLCAPLQCPAAGVMVGRFELRAAPRVA